MDVRVSIVMPVYNALPYLYESVAAVRAQTLQSWELLLVDDGSTDGSGEAADLLAAEDSRIRVFHQQNAGVSTARNRALNEAKGEYIGFVDADDTPLPHMFETLYAAASERACDIVSACYSSVQNGRIVYTSAPPFPADRIFGGADVHDWLCDMQQKGTFLYIWRRLFSAALIRENGIRFDPNISIGEDSLFCMECFLHAGRVCALTDVVYHYRHTPGSAMRSTAYKPNYIPSLNRLWQRKKALCLPLLCGKESAFLRDNADYTRKTLLPPLLRNFFLSPQKGYFAFRQLMHGELLRDTLRWFDLAQIRYSRSLDDVLVRFARWRLYPAAYWIARKLYRKDF